MDVRASVSLAQVFSLELSESFLRHWLPSLLSSSVAFASVPNALCLLKTHSLCIAVSAADFGNVRRVRVGHQKAEQ